jgi:hypothetical protein
MRYLTWLFFASFWAILLTGAVRKWVLPGVTVLYLLQDVPIGLAYVYALWKGIYDRGFPLIVVLAVSALLTLQALLQVIFSGLDPVVAFIGLHNYLFYLPILLVFPICLTEKRRRSVIWLTLMLSLPMSLLALAQNSAPKSAWINKTSEGEAFGVTGADVARVSGTFNFTLYYGIWVAIAVALCLGEWLLPKERRVIRNTALLIACTVAVNICHLVSASRTAILLAAVALVGAMVGAWAVRSTRAITAIAGIVVLLPMLAGLTYVISPDEFNVVVHRFSNQDDVNEGTSRIRTIAIGYITEPDFTLLGAGIGVGVDAAHVGNSNAYNFTYSYSEFDTTRNAMELGTPVGLAYLLVRFGFILGMVFLSFKIVKGGSTPHVLPLSFCLLAECYLGDLTRNATMTSSQVFMAYAFILGAYYYPDSASIPGYQAGQSLTRSV